MTARTRREIEAEIATLRTEDKYEREPCNRCGAATKYEVAVMCREDVPDYSRPPMQRRWCGQFDIFDGEGFCIGETERYMRLQVERDMAEDDYDDDDEAEEKRLRDERLVEVCAWGMLLAIVAAGCALYWWWRS